MKTKNKNKKENIFWHVLLVVGFITVFLTTLFARDPLYLPIHVDEWHHLEESRKLFDGHFSLNVNSYRIGFHILLLPLWFFYHAVPLSVYLPAVFALFSSAALYILVKHLFTTKTAVGSVALFSLFGSSFNLLGKDFLVPLGATLSLVFFYLLFWYLWLYKKKKTALYFWVVYIISGAMYPLSAMIFLPMLVYSLIKEKKYVHVSMPTMLVIGGLSILYVVERTFSSLLFKKGWGVVELVNMPWELLHWLVLILVIPGIFYIIKSGRFGILFISLFLAIWIAFFHLFSFSPLVPYQRVFFYFCVSLLFLAIVGLHSLQKSQAWIIPIILILAFLQPSLMQDRDAFIDQIDYHNLKQLENYPSGTVLTAPYQGVGVYPISGHKPIATVYFDQHRSSAAREQLLYCNTSNANYAYTDFELSCGELLYSKSFRYVYQLQE
ncbi:MAG: hypothetical protein ACMXYF_02340 [Candidatus Woesearchaeota archaeon]